MKPLDLYPKLVGRIQQSWYNIEPFNDTISDSGYSTIEETSKESLLEHPILNDNYLIFRDPSDVVNVTKKDNSAFVIQQSLSRVFKFVHKYLLRHLKQAMSLPCLERSWPASRAILC